MTGSVYNSMVPKLQQQVGTIPVVRPSEARDEENKRFLDSLFIEYDKSSDLICLSPDAQVTLSPCLRRPQSQQLTCGWSQPIEDSTQRHGCEFAASTSSTMQEVEVEDSDEDNEEDFT